VRRYLLSHRGEQIAEFVEVESGKRNDRQQLQAAMVLAKRRTRRQTRQSGAGQD